MYKTSAHATNWMTPDTAVPSFCGGIQAANAGLGYSALAGRITR